MGIGELAMKNARFVTLFQANQAGFDTFSQINNTTKIPWTALGRAVQGIRS